MAIDSHDPDYLNDMVVSLVPTLPKRNYAGNLHDAWELKNLMPVKYLPSLPIHQYNNPKHLSRLLTLAFIEWKQNELP